MDCHEEDSVIHILRLDKPIIRLLEVSFTRKMLHENKTNNHPKTTI